MFKAKAKGLFKRQNYPFSRQPQLPCKTKPMMTTLQLRIPFSLLKTFSTQSALKPPHQRSDPYVFRCNKAIGELSKLGKVDDARQLFDRMSQRDSFTWDSMISGYCRNNRIKDAHVLFRDFSGRNVKTWTAMLSGYAKAGLIEEARRCFDEMPERNVVSWNAMVSGYVQNGDLVSARRLFDEMPCRSVQSWNSMVTGYCHGCMMREARELFERMPERNTVSWMVVMSGYNEIGGFSEVWDLFRRMHSSGVMPDQAIFVVGLSAIIGLGNLGLVECLRSIAIKTGFERDVVVGTAILNAYTRNGRLDVAVDFLNGMVETNEYTWTTMIAAYSQFGRLNDAIAFYERIPEKTVSCQTAMVTAYAQNGRIQDAERLFNEIRNPNAVTWNAMITAYLQNRMFDKAKDIFMRMPIKNSASWAAIISGLVQNGQYEDALRVLAALHRVGHFPTHSCFTSSLSACANIGAVEVGKQIHALAIKRRYQCNPYVGNALIPMYARGDNILHVRQVFNSMEVKDIVSWNSLLTAFSDNCLLDEARETFEAMPERDIVSWSAMISAYAQSGHIDVALQLFSYMLVTGLRPSAFTLASLVNVCGSAGANKLGEQVHGFLQKLGFDSTLIVNNALITMYFKFGRDDGLSVFESMTERDIVTWNAVLLGYACNGLGNEAIKVFERMQAEAVSPDENSFMGLLSACSRAGLLDEGRAYFNSMSERYGIKPLVFHYTCMVDLLGRAGQLSEAEALVESMPVEPDSVIWEALLGACRIHHNVEVAERAVSRILQMDRLNPGTYVLLCNLYASYRRWDKVAEIRDIMKELGVTKPPGISWISIKDKLYTFYTGDKEHELFDDLTTLLKEYYGRLKMTGFVPETDFALHDVEEEQKENQLVCHSEKLALAFGLLSTPEGSPLLILKNLRICGDCHTFMKLMSDVTKRKIIIRDRKRYHHFQDGACSCADYW